MLGSEEIVQSHLQNFKIFLRASPYARNRLQIALEGLSMSPWDAFDASKMPGALPQQSGHVPIRARLDSRIGEIDESMEMEEAPTHGRLDGHASCGFRPQHGPERPRTGTSHLRFHRSVGAQRVTRMRLCSFCVLWRIQTAGLWPPGWSGNKKRDITNCMPLQVLSGYLWCPRRDSNTRHRD